MSCAPLASGERLEFKQVFPQSFTNAVRVATCLPLGKGHPDFLFDIAFYRPTC